MYVHVTSSSYIESCFILLKNNRLNENEENSHNILIFQFKFLELKCHVYQFGNLYKMLQFIT